MPASFPVTIHLNSSTRPAQLGWANTPHDQNWSIAIPLTGATDYTVTVPPRGTTVAALSVYCNPTFNPFDGVMA